MIRYDKYKPSGTDWIGEIPAGWEITKLKYITYLKGRVGWHGLKADEFNLNRDLPYCITGTDFKNGLIDWETCYHISEERYEEDPYIQIRKEDLLVTKDGTIGKVAIVKNLDGKAILNSGIFVMRPTERQYHTRFMYWLILSNAFEEFINYSSRGSTIIHLYQDTFLNWQIGLPPIFEQTAIANYLDEKTSQIDDLISKKQKLIELLKEERISVIKEAVSGDEKNWERKKLKYIAKDIQTGSTPPTNEEKYFSDELNWYTPSDFSDTLLLVTSKRKISFSAIENRVAKVFPSNSVLFVGIGATLGKVGYILGPAASNQQINCLSFSIKEEAIFYANFFYANQQSIVSLSNAATLPILNQSQMKEILLPVPSNYEEFISAINHIQIETGRIDNTISKIEKEIELMQEYRTALISEIVTGKVKVI